jgi:hypothetical protein
MSVRSYDPVAILLNEIPKVIDHRQFGDIFVKDERLKNALLIGHTAPPFADS